MTEKLIEAYAKKINATYVANLAFLEEKLPGIYKAVQTEAAGVKIDAEIDENAVLSFTLDGHPLPLTTLLGQAEESMRAFESDDRPAIEVRHPDSLPAKGQEFSVTDDPYTHDYYFSHHDFNARFGIDSAYTSRSGREEATRSPDFGNRNIPILIVFGSGYGSHLVELLDRYFVRHLIIVDNDPAITRLSLGFTDYIAIFNNHLMRRGTKFTMLCSRDAEVLARDIQAAIQAHWPPYFIHGIAVFRNLRNVELCGEVEQHLSRDLWLHYRGWGFFDDELMSVCHSLANLNRGRRAMRVEKAVSGNTVAFVVANGPSLDKVADLLRAHQDRAVIVSCGTALSAMYRLGIVPDFHIEVERPYWTVESLHDSVPPEFLAKIRLITPSVAHPEVFDGVAEGLMFLKEGDTSTAIFPDEYTRVSSFPTVSNGALSALLKLGFKSIYLLGVDLGARDPDQHHSSHSVYFNQEGISDNLKATLQIGASASAGMGMQAEGNFGGVVSTNDLLTLARKAMVSALTTRTEGQRVFNLNDGVLIQGAEPLKPEDFCFPEDSLPKNEAIEQILEAFVLPLDFDGAIMHERLSTAIHGMVGDLKPLLAIEIADKVTLIEKISMIHKEQNAAYAKHEPAYWALRGSIQHMQRRIYEYATYIKDEALAIEFATVAFAAIDSFLDKVVEVVDGIDPKSTDVPKVPAQLREQEAVAEA